MFLFAPRAHTFRPRRMALIASAMIAVVQIASAATAFYPLLLAGRVVTGFAYGVLNTAVNVAAGRTSQPARAISVGIALQVVLFAVMNVTIPRIGAAGGVGAMFIALGLISGTLALGMLPLPDNTEADASGHAHQDVPPMAPGGWPVLAAMALFAFGTMAIWPFMERAAHAIHLPATTFGLYQSSAMVLSSLGSFALTFVLARGARRGLLEIALMTCGTMCAVLTTVNSQVVFAIALQLYNVSWYITYPLLLGLAYAHDPHGRLAVRTTGTWLLAQSAGSLAAGFVAQVTAGYGVVGCLGMVTCAIAVGIVIWFQAGLQRVNGRAPIMVATGTAH
jgi:predicted MFS family arabinose efflux permease